MNDGLMVASLCGKFPTVASNRDANVGIFPYRLATIIVHTCLVKNRRVAD